MNELEIRAALQRLDMIEMDRELPNQLRRRAARRRTSLRIFTGAFILVCFAVVWSAGVQALPWPSQGIMPAGSPPVCEPNQIDSVQTDVSPPTGMGGGHYGVHFEVRINEHDADCQPTLFIKLDGAPMLLPDGQGPDADEFRGASIIGGERCIDSDRAEGNFLHTGRHVIEVGVGCDPHGSDSSDVVRRVTFHGETSSRVP